MEQLLIIPIGSTGSDIVNLVTGLAWPILVGILLILLMPTIRQVIVSRGFTVKAGGMEITVQQASDQLATRLDDLRDRVIGLETPSAGEAASGATAPAPQASDAGHPPTAPAPPAPVPSDNPAQAGLARLSRLLWVDDYPENNAFEIDALQRKGVQVVQTLSTSEALGALNQSGAFDAIITDMGRQDDGPDAGLKLLTQLDQLNITTPVIIYASAPAVARTREQAQRLGAYGVTASATELMTLLAGLGLS
jgi:CheY-like chemotaxis protein